MNKAQRLGMQRMTLADLKAIVDKLNEAVSKIASQPDVKQQWAKQGAAPLIMNPAAFDKYLQDDIAKWSGVIKSANIKLD